MKTRIISIALFALLIAAAATAQPAPRQGKILADYLQLTPDQIATWQQVGKDTAATVKPLVANAADLRAQLKAAASAATPDADAVGRLTLSLQGVRDQIRTARQAAQSKRLAALSADQRAKFDAFQAAVRFIRAQRGAAR